MMGSDRDTAAHFSRRAEAYAASPSHAHGEDLEIVAGFAAPGPHDRCLDIACGPGHTALRMAQKAGLVIAVDIAPGMLDATRRLAAERAWTMSWSSSPPPPPCPSPTPAPGPASTWSPAASRRTTSPTCPAFWPRWPGC